MMPNAHTLLGLSLTLLALTPAQAAPLQLALPAQPFHAEGQVRYQNGQLHLNGTELTLTDATRWEDGLTPQQLDGQWLEIEGQRHGDSYEVSELERDRPEAEIELAGWVAPDGTLWGYRASDTNLGHLVGRRVALECRRDPQSGWLSDCRPDH
ncbi:hypothetical protein [Ferrimonas balearica]|uniref:hypothetical protein n=1 Tax=Ferrimonas balearica TaxID=44012 RepID=UPI001C997053|nr:hypothetical protein [Ferrimonas balearica]MBY5993368.1 hypothetical protein [Ferrimonas balearica]